MISRFFSGINQKLAAQVISKVKPLVNKIETNNRVFNLAAIDKK